MNFVTVSTYFSVPPHHTLVITNMNMIPMIGGIPASILRRLVGPLAPRLDGINGHLPYALAPHHIAQAEFAAVVHNPFGYGFAFSASAP